LHQLGGTHPERKPPTMDPKPSAVADKETENKFEINFIPITSMKEIYTLLGTIQILI
jgi:hypothetical protein